MCLVFPNADRRKELLGRSRHRRLDDVGSNSASVQTGNPDAPKHSRSYEIIDLLTRWQL